MLVVEDLQLEKEGAVMLKIGECHFLSHFYYIFSFLSIYTDYSFQ